MEESLKGQIEKIVDGVLEHVLKNSELNRIVITTSANNILIRNYTHNRFLNKQPVINKEASAEIVYPYNPLKDKQEGAYLLYVDFLLSAREFLEEIATVFNSLGTFSRFEKWAEEQQHDPTHHYDGKYKQYLSKVVRYLRKMNSRGNTRVLEINGSYIEKILGATITGEVS